jgi:hypothetical protein
VYLRELYSTEEISLIESGSGVFLKAAKNGKKTRRKKGNSSSSTGNTPSPSVERFIVGGNIGTGESSSSSSSSPLTAYAAASQSSSNDGIGNGYGGNNNGYASARELSNLHNTLSGGGGGGGGASGLRLNSSEFVPQHNLTMPRTLNKYN